MSIHRMLYGVMKMVLKFGITDGHHADSFCHSYRLDWRLSEMTFGAQAPNEGGSIRGRAGASVAAAAKCEVSRDDDDTSKHDLDIGEPH